LGRVALNSSCLGGYKMTPQIGSVCEDCVAKDKINPGKMVINSLGDIVCSLYGYGHGHFARERIAKEKEAEKAETA